MPYVSDLLTAAAASVTGTPTPTRSWQWRRGATLISGATSSTYTVSEDDIGSAISVRQIERNVAGVATATSAATDVVQAFDPIALFQSGEEGAWYDPSDLTTLYQDAAGTTPVTAAGQPVGLMLDKSKGGLQAEKITNGGFDDATGWTTGNGTLTISGGVATIAGINGADPFFVSQSFSVNGGSWYKISANIISAGGSPLNLNYIRLRPPGSFAGATGIVVGSAVTGPVSAIVQIPAGWTQAELAVARGGNPIPPTTTLVVDDISIRELPGNHATQSTSTARPTLARIPATGVRNLARWTEQFQNAYWSTTTGGAGSAPVITDNYAVAPNGSVTAARLQAAAGGTTSSDMSIINEGISGGRTGSIWIKSNTGASQDVYFRYDSSNSTNVVVATAEWTRVDHLSSNTNAYFTIGSRGSANGSAPIDILIWGAQAEAGLSVTDYQKVTESYDVTEEGVTTLYYLDFDGVDDWMAMTYPSVLATPHGTAIAFDQDASGNGNRYIIDGATLSERNYVYSNPGSPNTFAVNGFIVNAVTFDPHVIVYNTNGTSSDISVDGVYSSPVNMAASAGTSGINISMAYVYGAYHSVMKLYGLLNIDRALTAAEIEATETYLATKSGVTLP